MGNRISVVAAALLAAAGAVLWAAADPDPAEVLQRVTAKVRATGRRLPNCTCVETITRENFHPLAAVLPRPGSRILEQRQHPTLDLVLRSFSIDRLRLDVAMTGTGEMFSWAGARQFTGAGIDQVVGGGAFGTGAFGGSLLILFEDEQPAFTFVRSLTDDGRRLMEYRYQVPAASSRYLVKADDAPTPAWVRTAYSRVIQVDPVTAEVVRLTVQTAELPPETGLCMSTSTVDYAPAQIGDYRVTLPLRMRQRFVTPSGVENENTTVLSNCREYKGESEISFSPESESPQPEAIGGSPAPVAPLPSGLRFSFVLTAPISTATAAAGDPFTGKLAEPLRDAGKKILAPRGALVHGRLVSVECFRRPPSSVVALRPESMEVDGVRVPLAALFDLVRERIENRGARPRREFALPPRREEQSGVFLFPGENVIVPRGFRSDWLTVEDSRETGRSR